MLRLLRPLRGLAMTLAFLLPSTLYPFPFSVVFAAEEPSLLQTIEAIERTDAQIASLTKELKSARSPAQRRQLQGQIDELQEKQQDSLAHLEGLVGPLSPVVTSEKPIPLEEQQKARTQRHEVTLDSRVDKR